MRKKNDEEGWNVDVGKRSRLSSPNSNRRGKRSDRQRERAALKIEGDLSAIAFPKGEKDILLRTGIEIEQD